MAGIRRERTNSFRVYGKSKAPQLFGGANGGWRCSFADSGACCPPPSLTFALAAHEHPAFISILEADGVWLSRRTVVLSADEPRSRGGAVAGLLQVPTLPLEPFHVGLGPGSPYPNLLGQHTHRAYGLRCAVGLARGLRGVGLREDVTCQNQRLTRHMHWTAGFRFSPMPSVPLPPPVMCVVDMATLATQQNKQ